MKLRLATLTSIFLGNLAGHHVAAQVATQSAQSELTDCIRTVMTLDEGRWDYMGTIAMLNGGFRTYEATSIHQAEGDDMWSSKSFGGDVGGEEATAQANIVALQGNTIVPIVDGVPNHQAAIQYKSCVGPDAEGRYEVQTEYMIPNPDGTFDTAKNVSWYSKHGSYYSEDHYNESGRIVSRRSGVNTPADTDTSSIAAQP